MAPKNISTKITKREDMLPRYAEIQRDIERKIIAGEWAPGDRIPAENELVKVYGCARMTVNKALSGLAAAGIIVRKRGSGSFVAVPRADGSLLTIQDIKMEVLSIDRTYSYRLLDRYIRIATDPVDARHVGVPVNTRILCLDVVHYADSLPFTLETRQINLAAVPEAENATFDTESPGAWLLRNVVWGEAEHSIRAINADEIMANTLQISSGTACLSIARRTWKNGNLITFVRLVYPGERHRFVARFTPSTLSGG
jgi:GntR family transcriptional regulator, histidine utilization repressor